MAVIVQVCMHDLLDGKFKYNIHGVLIPAHHMDSVMRNNEFNYCCLSENIYKAHIKVLASNSTGKSLGSRLTLRMT